MSVEGEWVVGFICVLGTPAAVVTDRMERVAVVPLSVASATH
jgi:hypothetical protein